MSFKFASVSISKIYLDNDNPRHDPIDNEPDIIQYLYLKEKVKPLASDIVKSEGTSPLERLALVEHPRVKGSYIVLEGNRRICALKLLADPEKAPKEQDKKYFRNLKAKLLTPITALDVVIFTSRGDAKHWLEIRHEGELEGVGTRQWNALQKERHNRDGGLKPNNNRLASLLLDYALSRKLITQTQLANIGLTTITRFVSSPVFRHAIGLHSNKQLSINVPQAEFDIALKRFLEDALLGKDGPVNSRTKIEDRQKYSETLRTDGVAPKTRTDTEISLDPATGKATGGSTQEQAENKKKRDNKSPDHRNSVIPKDFTAHLNDNVLKRLYDELKTINHDEHSFAASYLLRGVIERAIILYCRENGLGHQDELHKLCGRVVIKLEADGIDSRELKPLREMCNSKDSKISPDTLGAWVHGSVIPTKVEINRRWETLQPIMKMIFDRLK